MPIAACAAVPARNAATPRRWPSCASNLLTAEAIIKAEPQVLVFWEQGQGVRVMAHTLGGVAGLPESMPSC